MRRLSAILCALLLSTCWKAGAASTVESLKIEVELQDDGSALVHECWHIDVSDGITEWYLVENLPETMRISNLMVADESGTEYVNEGEWDVDRSRKEKAFRCGMVTKRSGYELCWGVGSEGRHVYDVRYTLSGLVKGFVDADGFNHMFVSRGLDSAPEDVRLEIRKKGKAFTTSDTKVWAFGCKGEIQVLDGAVKAWSSEPFSHRSGLIVMVAFEKGIFNPAVTESRSFEDVKSEAFEGGDYGDGSPTFWDKFITWVMAFLALILGLFFVSAIVYGIKSAIKKSKKKRELLGGKLKDVPWFRDVPVSGDLRRSYNILQIFDPHLFDLQHLLGAYMARLHYKGALSVVPQQNGKPAFRINEYAPKQESGDIEMEKRVYDFFKEAAGEDSILQQKELKRWSEKHGEELYKWQQDVPDGCSVWSLSAEEVRQVIGLRRYLKDFTLIKDRGVLEVGLWTDYLVFASLYGIAKQLYKDYKKVCPEYFTLAEEAYGNDAAPLAVWDVINTTTSYMNQSALNHASGGSSGRLSGGGGSISFGGGGGFSGGGGGGGR